jgi:DNA-binding NarL/FixJ family response regulator
MRPDRNLTDITEPVIFAHPSLDRYLEASETRLRSYFLDSVRIEFIDYIDLNSADVSLDSAILLPVNSEHQADNLRSVRTRHPMALLIAITNDVTGHPTYYAIRSGATFVVNLAIPSEDQSAFVQSQLHFHTQKSAAVDMSGQFDSAAISRASADNRTTANGATEVHAAGGRRGAGPVLERPEIELIRMLRTPMTVAEIARQNYMSERSMYRRVRKLYDVLGITGRAELHSYNRHAI